MDYDERVHRGNFDRQRMTVRHFPAPARGPGEGMMDCRKWLGLGVFALGVVAGCLLAAEGDWASRLVMGAIGALYALPVALALSGSGRARPVTDQDSDLLPGESPGSPEALMANYWRDRGHLPFMKPSEAEPDEHMFDPDRLD